MVWATLPSNGPEMAVFGGIAGKMPPCRRCRRRASYVEKGHFIRRDQAGAASAPPESAVAAPKRPRLLATADELGEEELGAVIAALVALREARGCEAGVEAS